MEIEATQKISANEEFNPIIWQFSEDEADPVEKALSKFELQILDVSKKFHPVVQERFPLYKGSTIVGRAPDSQTSFPAEELSTEQIIKLNDPTISKNHAIIHVEGKEVFLEDLNSTNGCRRSMEKRVLTPGRLYEIQIKSEDQTIFYFGSLPLRIVKNKSQPERVLLKKRKRGVISPAKRAPPTQESAQESEETDFETPAKVRRKSERISKIAASPTRRGSLKEMPAQKGIFMWTGVQPSSSQLKIIKELGWSNRSDLAALRNRKVTHVVADKIRRTVKFFVAVAQGIPIVSSDYLYACASEKKLLGTSRYILKDKASEEKFGFSLEQSIKKAKEKPFLKGYYVFMCHSVQIVARNEMKLIVEAGGGIWLEKLWGGNRSDVITIGTDMDKLNYRCRIFGHDIILNGALTQKLDFEIYLIQPGEATNI
eukprot:GHVP01003415.1.p1 GENE.GHVP01003415.1~~GHVP01003415.1.p1  ORF type:complete len:439 (-),score=97.10 GHVP01003415.1:692-1972(-)